MSGIESRHAHRLIKHRNQKRYNWKPAISNRTKVWRHRNNLWCYKRIYAYWLIGNHKSFGSHGSNQLEQHHSNLKKSLTYLQKGSVGLNRLPAVAAIGKLRINWSKVYNILCLNKYKLSQYGEDDQQMMKQIFNELDKIRGFNKIWDCYDETGFVLYFDLFIYVYVWLHLIRYVYV